jgi:hypothetical protein
MSDAAEPKEVSTVKPNILSFFRRKYVIEKELWDQHHIRGDGKYAELLVAEALGAHVLTNGVTRGSDLVHPSYKRIEVRSRRKPLGKSKELRAVLPESKRGYFEHFVHVAFDSDYTVVRSYILPHDSAYGILESGKLSFDKGAAMSDAVDITAKVIAAQTRV